MTEVGYTPINLPSQGVLYTDSEGASLVPEGMVHVRQLTVRENSILYETGVQINERVNQIIKLACKLPDTAVQGGLTHDDLLVTDRLAILISLRLVTFDGKYSFKWKCDECGASNTENTDIKESLNEITPEKIAEKQLRDGLITEDEAKSFVLAEPIKVTLRDAGKTVGVRFMRGKDEEQQIKFARKARASKNTADDPLVFRLGLQIVQLEGEKLSGREKDAFIRSLTMRDIREIEIAIEKHETGIDMGMMVDCRACGATNEKDLPINAEFFRPTEL